MLSYLLPQAVTFESFPSRNKKRSKKVKTDEILPKYPNVVFALALMPAWAARLPAMISLISGVAAWVMMPRLWPSSSDLRWKIWAKGTRLKWEPQSVEQAFLTFRDRAAILFSSLWINLTLWDWAAILFSSF